MENETDKSQPPHNDEKDISILKQKLKVAQLENQLTVELAKNGAQDFETAALVAKSRMKAAGTADVREIVKAVKEDKPFLFATAAASPKRTQPVKTDAAQDTSVVQAAKRAAQNGNRQDVLEYMRARRGN